MAERSDESPDQPFLLTRQASYTFARAVDGHVAVPEAPGLGVELNEEVVERYAVKT